MKQQHVFSAMASLRISVKVALVSSVTSRFPFRGQLDADDPGIARVRATAHETGCLRAVHQPDSAVTLQQQVIRYLADDGGWPPG